jgi:hypothetical protein
MKLHVRWFYCNRINLLHLQHQQVECPEYPVFRI